MIFNIITLFPEFFETPFKTGLLGKAVAKGLIGINLYNIRDFSDNKFRRCDDYPFGGGSGMVLMAEPIIKAIEDIKSSGSKIILTSPGGNLLSQAMVKELASNRELTIICGHYEGIDQRVVEKYIDYEISIGDYILSGGEFAALVMVDSIARYVPGFMSNDESLLDESFEYELLEYPHYTRPREVDGSEAPEVLISGNHDEISKWRLNKQIEKTKKVRPDLYKKYLLKIIKGDE